MHSLRLLVFNLTSMNLSSNIAEPSLLHDLCMSMSSDRGENNAESLLDGDFDAFEERSFETGTFLLALVAFHLRWCLRSAGTAMRATMRTKEISLCFDDSIIFQKLVRVGINFILLNDARQSMNSGLPPLCRFG